MEKKIRSNDRKYGKGRRQHLPAFLVRSHAWALLPDIGAIDRAFCLKPVFRSKEPSTSQERAIVSKRTAHYDPYFQVDPRKWEKVLVRVDFTGLKHDHQCFGTPGLPSPSFRLLPAPCGLDEFAADHGADKKGNYRFRFRERRRYGIWQKLRSS